MRKIKTHKKCHSVKSITSNPHSLFNYSSSQDEDFRKCWALSNLRPLSSKQNHADGVSRARHQIRVA